MADNKNKKLKFGTIQKQVFAEQRKFRYSDDVKGGIAYYGVYNDLPDRYLKLLDDSPTHYVATEGTVRFIQANGLTTASGELPMLGPMDGQGQRMPGINTLQETWSELFEKIAWDFKVLGGFAIEVIWNRDRSAIAELYHIPFKDVRAEEKNYRGLIENWYVSNRWNKIKTPNDDTVRLPIFNANKRADEPKQILVVKAHNPNSEYYPEPDYKGGLSAILIEKLVALFKVKYINSAIATSLIIQTFGNFTDDSWTDLMRNINSLQGANNAGDVPVFNSASAADAIQFTTNTSSKAVAETYNTWIDYAKDDIYGVHSISAQEAFGSDSDEAWLGADNVMEKFQLFLNTKIRSFQMPILNGLNKIGAWMGVEDFSIEPMELFEGLQTNVEPITPETDGTSTPPVGEQA